MSTLYIVGTPIGHLEDITLRALETLKSVDLIACEDTRQSMKLLSRYEIRKPLLSCHGYNESRSAEKILEAMSGGKNVAYVSDAGTPGLSDPGAVLIRTVRDAGFPVVPIPGPSAFASLVSVSGFGGRAVLFEGFLSPKPGRRRGRLKELLERGESFLVYESPFRVTKLLTDIEELAPEANVLVGREMTKIHEEFLEGTAGEIRGILEARPKIQGEFAVLICSGKTG
jgi:16S rRNA (cytidine1402-2'-O)-methyltransferase